MIKSKNSVKSVISDKSNRNKRMSKENQKRAKNKKHDTTKATYSKRSGLRSRSVAGSKPLIDATISHSTSIPMESAADQMVEPSPHATAETNIVATLEATSNSEDQVVQRRRGHRGPNKCANLQGNVKTIVKVNRYGQPNCRNARKLSSFLGLLSRDPKLIPLDIKDWRKFLSVETEETLWNMILTRFTFEGPKSPRDWTMVKLNHCLRSWRVKLKMKYYRVPKEANVPLVEILKQPTPRVDPSQWIQMVFKWESTEGQACSERNTDNQNKSTMTHHLGTKSFAILREEETTNGIEPDELELFKIAYGQKKDKPVDLQSAKILEQIDQELEKLPPDCDIGNERKRIYKDKIGDDKRGYKRTFGIGVTQSTSSKHEATEALLMVEAEREKRRALEDEIAMEKLRRMELENEITIQAEKRKDLEEIVKSEKEKRESLEDKVHRLTNIVLIMQANGNRESWTSRSHHKST